MENENSFCARCRGCCVQRRTPRLAVGRSGSPKASQIIATATPTLVCLSTCVVVTKRRQTLHCAYSVPDHVIKLFLSNRQSHQTNQSLRQPSRSKIEGAQNTQKKIQKKTWKKWAVVRERPVVAFTVCARCGVPSQ